MSLADGVLAGDRLALARLLTQVENDTEIGRTALDRLFSHTGKAHLVGVTGSPGTGKSSLVNQLARVFRNPEDGQRQYRVAIVAVDPSSPFTGGAILGDRVRMRDLTGDPGVFIRSMASRGALGGLARATAAVVQVLDAAGFDLVLIETVGAGQSEVDIACLAHTTLVVEAPGMGDDIQAIKAGIMEVADILVINKADRPGVENTERALQSNLDLGRMSSRDYRRCGYRRLKLESRPDSAAEIWHTPILKTIAPQGIGVSEVGQAIRAHGQHLQRTGEWEDRDRQRLETELDHLLQATLVARWRAGVTDETYLALLNRLVSRQTSPNQVVAELVPSEQTSWIVSGME